MASYTAGDVIDLSAAFLNDTGRAVYEDSIQLPYLKVAQEELEQHLITDEIPISLISEAIIEVPEGDTELALPSSFFVPIYLEERRSGTSTFSPVKERRTVDRNSPVASENMYIWDYRHNCINFVGSTEDREIKLTYWRHFPTIVTGGSEINIDGAKNTLAFRTAAMCARYIGNNKERSDELNMESIAARDLLLNLYVKNTQGVRARRRPFRTRHYASW